MVFCVILFARFFFIQTVLLLSKFRKDLQALVLNVQNLRRVILYLQPAWIF